MSNIKRIVWNLKNKRFYYCYYLCSFLLLYLIARYLRNEKIGLLKRNSMGNLSLLC